MATNVDLPPEERERERDSPLLTNASYTNTGYPIGQVSIATEVENPEEKNTGHLPPLRANN
jgi:hypothetical protein